MAADGLKSGVSINSRYCSFCEAARAGYFVEPLAQVALLVKAAEAVECGKEMVVPALAGDGHKAPHGEAVDQLVVEVLVLDGDSGLEFARAAGGAGLLVKGERGRVHAQAVLGGVAQPGLGVDGA